MQPASFSLQSLERAPHEGQQARHGAGKCLTRGCGFHRAEGLVDAAKRLLGRKGLTGMDCLVKRTYLSVEI